MLSPRALGKQKSAATRHGWVFQQSLKRLQVDCLDLVQHREIIRFDDAHRISDPEGENAALAPQSGLIGSKG